MNYWLDLFTGTTWNEFRNAGASITGFSAARRTLAERVEPGDIFLCYLTGVKQWVGALEVLSPSSDNSRIWTHGEFPLRFNVRPILLLEPEHGVPMDALEGQVDFFPGPEYRGKYKGFVRQSPNPFKPQEDGKFILNLLREAQNNPVTHKLDPKKLARKPRNLYKAELHRGKATIPTIVSVPGTEEDTERLEIAELPAADDTASTTRPTEIQYHLLSLGMEMGLDIWVARNDRSKAWNGQTFGKMQRSVTELPTQFNEATNKTIELIDVLWLRGNTFIAAFKVDCTTTVYSGLLRMSDLLALQPNLNIELYLVAPYERRNKVEQEILRPTFGLREKPLAKECGFLPFSVLMEKIEGIRRLGLGSSLRPDFLRQTAVFFNARSSEPISVE
jgi:hypothetical protein